MGADGVHDLVGVTIIDDHEVVRDGLVSRIQGDPERRFTVVHTGDAFEEALSGPGTAADVLLLDLELHGTLMVDRLIELTSVGRRVVVFTQHGERDTVLAVQEAGAHYLNKSEAVDHLLDALVEVAADRGYVTPTAAGAILEDDRPGRPDLTDKQVTALRHWFQGMSKASVGVRMGISERSVKQHVERVRIKYAAVGRPCASKDALLARAIEDGVISAEEVGDYVSRAARTEADDQPDKS